MKRIGYIQAERIRGNLAVATGRTASHVLAAVDSIPSVKAEADTVLTGTPADTPVVQAIMGALGGASDIVFQPGHYSWWEPAAHPGYALTIPYSGMRIINASRGAIHQWGAAPVTASSPIYLWSGVHRCAFIGGTVQQGLGGPSSLGLASMFYCADFELAGTYLYNWDNIAFYLHRSLRANLHNFISDYCYIPIWGEMPTNNDARIHDFMMRNVGCWGMNINNGINFEISNFIIDKGTEPWAVSGVTPTTVSIGCSAGDVVVPGVAILGNFEDHGWVKIGTGATEETREYNKAANTCVCTRVLAYDHAIGEALVEVRQQEHGLYLQESGHNVHDGTIKGFPGFGIRSSDTLALLGNHHIHDMRISDCHGGGLAFSDDGNHHYLDIHDNEFYDCGKPKGWYETLSLLTAGVMISTSGSASTDLRERHMVHHNFVRFTSQPAGVQHRGIDIFGPNDCVVDANTIIGTGDKNQIGIENRPCGMVHLAERNTFRDNKFTNVHTEMSDTGLNTIVQNDPKFLTPGIENEYVGSLAQVAQNGAVIAFQNPGQRAALASALVRITTPGGVAATGPMGLTTSVVVEDCEDAWNESVLAEVTSTLNTTDFERGAGSAQLAVAAGVVDDEILATEARAAQDLSAYTHLLFKIKSSVATAAADLRMLISENINCGAPAETLDVPALVAGQWTLVVVPFVNAGATRDAIISIGLQYHDNPAVCTILIDDVRAITVGTTMFTGAAVDLNAAAIYDSMNVADAGAGQGKPIAIDAKNGTNDVLVMVATGGAAGAIVGSYYIKMVGQ